MPRGDSVRHRRALVDLIVDRAHYDEVVQRALGQARVSLWIGTANVKDVRVEAPIGSVARARGRYLSITERFVELVRRGVEIRILHARPPSRAFRSALAATRALEPPLFEMRECPRTHLKTIAVDGSYLYLGSANFTGAGLGARGDERRNFEIGIATEDDVLLDEVQRRFDDIWSGRECAGCKLRAQCPKPIDTLVEKRKRRARSVR
ncbi:MAG: phospholipase D family protein [Pseudomonadota bacterium]|nr:MAG: phospholipase [Pseudomonadota bacterium]